MRPRHVLIALAAGLALADASVVTLALPDLLVQLNTSVEGVAAVIGVYTVVVAGLLIPAERLARRLGPAHVGAGGFALFALASLVCGASGSLPLLLVARAVQAAGGAAGLICAFEMLHGEHTPARQLWLAAAVLSAAVGPALGGALTQAFSWRAIFYAQAPVGIVAAVVAFGAADRADVAPPTESTGPPSDARAWRARAALALVSAALSAVLFLLVLLLVAGWAIAPLAAAGAVTVLPAAALAGSRIGGVAQWRAAAGCALVGFGTIALAYLPGANVAWTLAPQALAGLGMGMALPALGGELLPERDARDASVLLTVRHVGIAVALAILAPVTAARLESATRDAREQGVALVLDARLDPTLKIGLAPALLQGVEDSSPRKGLQDAVREQRSTVSGDQVAAYDTMATRADDVLVSAVGRSFFWAFWITGAFALLGAVVLVARAGMPAWLPGAVAAGVAVVVIQIVAWHGDRPARVAIADPCKPRALPDTGGITGFFQDRALELLDRTACRLGSSREELVLALADPADAKRFEQRHGENPRSASFLLSSLLGG